MGVFDQATWQSETTWGEPSPTPRQVWDALQSRELPEGFRGHVSQEALTSGLIRAGLAQSLEASGLAGQGLVEKLRELTGRRILERTLGSNLAARAEIGAWKVRFTNLVSGRFTELLFERAFRPHLEVLGLRLTEETAHRNYLDYRISDREGFEIAVNLKNAGVQYRDAARWVHLEPEDTLPIATYKIFGSEVAPIPPLIYVYLFDWRLLERLRRAYWTIVLNEAERRAFRLLANLKGVSRNLEDAFIETTVASRLELLMDAVGYHEDSLSALPFCAISAAKCRRIFYEQHERSPYVYRQRMNTDPNVHISVSKETKPFAEFVEHYLSSADVRAMLLEDLARTRATEVPAPTV